MVKARALGKAEALPSNSFVKALLGCLDPWGGLGGEGESSPLPDTEPNPGPSLVKDSCGATHHNKGHPLKAQLCLKRPFLTGHWSPIAG